MDDKPTAEATELHLVEGQHARCRWPLTDELTIGRASECTITLASTRVSRRHCMLQRGPEGWLVRDLQSRNGTLVNGVRIDERPLLIGDRLSVSEWSFVLGAPPAKELAGRSGAPDLSEGFATEELTVSEGLYFAPEEWVGGKDAEAGLSLLVKLGTELPRMRSFGDLELTVLPLVLRTVPANRVILLRRGEGVERFEVSGGGQRGLPISTTVVDRVYESGSALLSRRVAEDEQLSGSASVAAAAIESLVAVPLLLSGERTTGVLYVDRTAGRPGLVLSDLRLLTAVAGMIAPALSTLERVLQLEEQLAAEVGAGAIGDSPAMARVADMVSRVASASTTVLIRGESGTGKEVVAREIHQQGDRSREPFVAINCATLSESLLESELFGHERGAFTGAVERKIGKLEVANGGTLFLDEIGELPLALQPKLLRVLETLEFERVGGTATLSVDVRILAATNRDLEAALADRSFREDLLFRLNVIEIWVPPLRERPKDIDRLSAHFLAHFSRRSGRSGLTLSAGARRRLSNHSWPGNVRELRNAIERAVVLCRGEVIEPEDLPDSLSDLGTGGDGSADGYQEILQRTKVRLIQEALHAESGNVTRAAERLRLSPNYLHRLMTKLGVRQRNRAAKDFR